MSQGSSQSVVETSDNEEQQELYMIKAWKESRGSIRSTRPDGTPPRKRMKLDHFFSPPMIKLTKSWGRYRAQSVPLESHTNNLSQPSRLTLQDNGFEDHSYSQDPLLLESDVVDNTRHNSPNSHGSISPIHFSRSVSPGVLGHDGDLFSDDELLLRDEEMQLAASNSIAPEMSRCSISPKKMKSTSPSRSPSRDPSFSWSSPLQFPGSETTRAPTSERTSSPEFCDKFPTSPPRTASSAVSLTPASRRHATYASSLFGSPIQPSSPLAEPKEEESEPDFGNFTGTREARATTPPTSTASPFPGPTKLSFSPNDAGDADMEASTPPHTASPLPGPSWLSFSPLPPNNDDDAKSERVYSPEFPDKFPTSPPRTVSSPVSFTAPSLRHATPISSLFGSPIQPSSPLTELKEEDPEPDFGNSTGMRETRATTPPPSTASPVPGPSRLSFSPLPPNNDDDADMELTTPRPTVSPLPGPSRLPTPSSPHSNHDDDDLPPPPPNQLQADAALDPALYEEHNARGRYSLRTRQPKQLNPYGYENAVYRLQLRANPEAIVKVVSPHRGSRHRAHDDYREEASPPRRRTPPPRARTPPRGHLDEIDLNLPGVDDLLSASDEEGAKERAALSKEGRRLLREQRRKEKEAQKNALALKRFPVRDGHDAMDSRSARRNSSPLSNVEPCSPRRRRSSLPSRHIHRHSRTVSLRLSSSPPPFQAEPPDLFPGENDVEVLDYADNTASVHSSGDEGIDISSDEEETPEQRELARIDRKRRKAAKRMMPKVMYNREMGITDPPPATQRSRPRPRHVQARHSSEAEELRPGHAKTRISRYPRDDRPILGDSESEDEPRRSPSASPPAFDTFARPYSPLPLRRTASHHDVIDITSSGSSSSESESDVVGDEDIKAHLGDEPAHRGGSLRERSLVDYMLSRTRVIGQRKQRQSSSKRRAGEPRRHDHGHGGDGGGGGGASGSGHGGGGGAGVGRPHTNSQPHSRSSKKRRHKELRQTKLYEYDVDEPSTHEIEIPDDAAKKRSTYKEKEKKRKRRLQATANGLYTLTHGGIQVSVGHERRPAFNAFLEDEGLSLALRPATFIAPKPQAPARRASITRPANTAPLEAGQADLGEADWDILAGQNIHIPEEPSDVEPPRRRHRKISIFDMPPLRVGRTFGDSTYIGRGWLHDLLTVVTEDAQPVCPEAYVGNGFDISNTTSVVQFVASLQELCNRLLDPPVAETEEELIQLTRQWQGAIRIHNQFLSWLLKSSSPEDAEELEAGATGQILFIVGKLREAMMSEEALTHKTLTIGWFAIEIAVRLGKRFSQEDLKAPAEAPLISQTVLLMVQRLLKFGMRKPLESIHQHEDSLECTTVKQRAAETWICLIHTINAGSTADSKASIYGVAQHILAADASPNIIATSERIWQTIYGLCFLSQFSDVGMVKSTPSLPPSWELVLFALRQVNLRADEQRDRTSRGDTIEKRDLYVSAIMRRCLNLWRIWHWSLEGASPVIMELSHIFRTRKFANLVHEHTEFPKYLRDHDMSFFEADDAGETGETAFEMFLRLVVHAIKPYLGEDRTAPQNLPPKAKKLFSTFIPSGPILFSKGTQASEEQHSRLFNRFTAISIAIYFDLSSVTSRTQQARGYVQFLEMDMTTKTTCIRGILYLALFTINLGLLPTDALDWFGHLTTQLVEECQIVSRTPASVQTVPGYGKEPSIVMDHLTFTFSLIIRSLRVIQEAHVAKQPVNTYPNPAFLQGAWVDKVIASTEFSSKAAKEIRPFMLSFLAARAAALPEPQRPRLASPTSAGNEESQDYYEEFDDFDFNDAALNAVLGDDASNEAAKQDAIVAPIIHNHVYPTILRLTGQKFRNPDPDIAYEGYLDEADRWIDCWIGCADVIVRNGIQQWLAYIETGRGAWESITDTVWRRRVSLKTMFSILTVDPMTYPTFQADYLRVFAECLAVADITIEHEFVSLLFTIDGRRHPLLKNIECPLKAESTDVVMSRDYYIASRVNIIDTIFANVNDRILESQADNDPSLSNECEQLVDWLRKMLVGMKMTYQPKKRNNDSGLAAYTSYCSRVFDKLNAYPAVKSHYFLSSLVKWGSELE